MILIDTGPLVAFFDASDRYHDLCIDILRDLTDPLLTTWPVITEALFLLDFSWKAQEALWEFVLRGGLEIRDLSEKALVRCRTLMGKYRDIPMDLADATLVASGEELKLHRIFTLDHKDFQIYRPLQAKRFELLPADVPKSRRIR
jgi:predicted nucleic acid-binding protein